MPDLIIKNGQVVFPARHVKKEDIGITNGKISDIGVGLDEKRADTVIDASGKFVFPGIIDTHFHAGLYRPLSEDARTESASAIAGGVTTVLSYFRTGRNYMNSSDPYSTLFKDVLKQSEGNFHTDYGYHLAPITRKHLEEMPLLVRDFGVTSFKYYMFYRSQDILGEPKPGSRENEYLLSEDPYDLGHLYSIMNQISRIRREEPSVRLSVHAEDPDLIRVSMEAVRNSPGGLAPLQLYSHARPPESERFGIVQAAELSLMTGCPINILHLSSGLGLKTIKDLRRDHPDLDVVLETCAHYLLLTDDRGSGMLGKVNPPIRGRQDQDLLWEGIARNDVNTVASDHCCSQAKDKGPDIWSAKPAFASTELLLPALVTEGTVRRGIPLEHVVALLTSNPARHFGIWGRKGDIAIGFDADLAICDLTT